MWDSGRSYGWRVASGQSLTRASRTSFRIRQTGTAAVNEFWSYQIVEGKLQTTRRTGTSTSGRLASSVTEGFGRQVSSSSPSPAVDGEFVTLTTGYTPGTRRAVSLTSITAHTRLGQPSTITQSGIGSETITFRPGLGVPLTHSYASSHTLLPGKQIAYNVPDAYGQPTGFTPSDGPAVTFVWDQGLLHTVSTTHGTHSYEYRQDTAQMKNVTASNGTADTFRQTYSRDIANRLLAASSSVPGTTPVPLTRHGYRLDELNRRTNTTLLDGSTWTWGYNDRSEVTAASRKQLGGTDVAALGATYSYDEIGNRMTSTSPILGDFGYTTNSVNQYATITSNNSRTVLGKAPATSTITVNGLATTRIDTLFHKGISVDNSNDPLWLQADVSDGTTTQTRDFWLPKASTALTYLGGNLTNDGQWSYLWDAENRLVEMEATIAAVNAGCPYRKLAFAYDWTGRRLARTITATNNSVISATRWLYDGWNPVAEYSPLETGNLKLETSYLWGLDISGTLTEAGGVGGLLAVITSNPTNVYYPSFDGNGNITAWTQSGATAPVCRREYDAFGNIVVEQGTAPCAFGFSTKLEDPETHLLYYGYRYYDSLTGRWLSKDPIEEDGGLNLYGFVGNDGVIRVDLFGLQILNPKITNGGFAGDCKTGVLWGGISLFPSDSFVSKDATVLVTIKYEWDVSYCDGESSEALPGLGSGVVFKSKFSTDSKGKITNGSIGKGGAWEHKNSDHGLYYAILNNTDHVRATLENSISNTCGKVKIHFTYFLYETGKDPRNLNFTPPGGWPARGTPNENVPTHFHDYRALANETAHSPYLPSFPDNVDLLSNLLETNTYYIEAGWQCCPGKSEKVTTSTYPSIELGLDRLKGK